MINVTFRGIKPVSHKNLETFNVDLLTNTATVKQLQPRLEHLVAVLIMSEETSCQIRGGTNKDVVYDSEED